MWNIFEHWWTAIIVALAVQIVLAIIHIIKPGTRKLWHILIPLIILAGGIGVEWFVQTDMEKVKILLSRSLTATENEDMAAIDAILAPDYSDSVNNSKDAFMTYCKRWFSRPLIAQNKLPNPPEITINAPNAQINLSVVIHLDSRSEYYGDVRLVLIKLRLHLYRYAGGKWLIKSAELLEINNQRVKWNEI
jgi:hypothetical protein